jgi:hypothetical protein
MSAGLGSLNNSLIEYDKNRHKKIPHKVFPVVLRVKPMLNQKNKRAKGIKISGD